MQWFNRLSRPKQWGFILSTIVLLTSLAGIICTIKDGGTDNIFDCLAWFAPIYPLFMIFSYLDIYGFFWVFFTSILIGVIIWYFIGYLIGKLVNKIKNKSN
jgi:hypothetical protein